MNKVLFYNVDAGILALVTLFFKPQAWSYMFFTFLIQYFTIREGRKKEERMGGRTEGRIKSGKKEETGGQLENP